MTIKRIQAYTLSELIDKANELAGKFADKKYSSDIPAYKWATRAAEKAKQFVTEAVTDCDLTCNSEECWAAMLNHFGFTDPDIVSSINDSPEDGASFTSNVDINKLVAWLVDTNGKPMSKSPFLTEEEFQQLQNGFDVARGTEYEYLIDEECMEREKEREMEYLNYILGRPELYYPKVDNVSDSATNDRKFRNELDWLQWVNPDDRWFNIKVVRQGFRLVGASSCYAESASYYYESQSDRKLLDEKLDRLASAVELIRESLCIAMTADLRKMYQAATSDESLIDYANANEYLFASNGTPIHHLIEEDETPETPE